MALTAQKHAAIVIIVKPVILTQGNVMIMGVHFRVCVHQYVMNVDLDLTDLTVALIAVRTVKKNLVTVPLENACMVVNLDIKCPIASCLVRPDIMEIIAPRHVETV